MHPDVIAVAETTAVHRAKYNAFCRSLSEAELQRPIPDSHWRVVDYISHLASIDIWVGKWFAAWADGRDFDFKNDDGSWMNIDTWNDERINERKDAPLEDLLTEAANHRTNLEATMAKFSPELLARPFDFRGANITFLRYLQLWAAHDPAHSADMLKALPERASDPDLKAWIESVGIALTAVADVNAKLAE
jgi:hypothetical protein